MNVEVLDEARLDIGDGMVAKIRPCVILGIPADDDTIVC